MTAELRAPAPTPRAPATRPGGGTSSSHVLTGLGILIGGGVLGVVSPLVLVVLLGLLTFGAVIYLSPRDPVTILSLGVLAMFGMPARYIFEPLGAAGAPAIMFGVAAFAWWLTTRLSSASGAAHGHNPVRVGTGVLLVTMLASYAAGFARPLQALEASNSDRTMIIWFAYFGYLLLAADGLNSRERLDTLLHRIVWGTTFMAVVGLLQFLADYDLTEVLALPGLTYNVPEFTSNFARSDFTRVAGTALHPIEFGVVGASIMPLALHYAFNDVHKHVIVRWTPIAIIGFAVPMAVSRSAILGLVVIGLVQLPTLPSERRFQTIMAAFFGAGAMTVVVPGLLGTIKSFFVNADEDPSIEGRTEDVETVIAYFREAPFFGRGTGTFTPALYDFLDNQFFMQLIETGAVGMLGLVFFMVVAIWTARQVRRWTIVRDRPTADLAQAMVACIAVHFFTFATYDALSFRITGMSLFLIVGAAGALWRLERPVVEFATTEGR